MKRFTAAMDAVWDLLLLASALSVCVLGFVAYGSPLWAAEPISLVQSSPMGFPCRGITTPFPCSEANNGWIVVVKGDAAAYRGVLKYRDADGSEKTETVVAATVQLDQVEPEKRGSYASLAFRLGRFLPSSDFLGVEITALREAEKITIP